jgi:Icc-related predicted phosphoesterase
VSACVFVSDLHGYPDRYEKLFSIIERERPAAVFVGGDILPTGFVAPSEFPAEHEEFIADYLVRRLFTIRDALKGRYPRVFLILGNDDGRLCEPSILDAAAQGIWEYVHDHKVAFGEYVVYGYQYVPPTPFLLKDWERYDVSRYVDPGSVSPEEGRRSVPVREGETRYATIQEDLKCLVGKDSCARAIFLFHSPPHDTKLDRAALDGLKVDHVPLDPHVGSVAIRRFIESRQPLITLHGHIHESARITGNWRDQLGRTHMFSAAHDGPELAVVRFDTDHPEAAARSLI